MYNSKMPDGQNKRFALVRVYQILSEFSDEEHHLKHTEIMNKLEQLYDMVVDRKLIRAKINDINDLGQKYGIEVLSEQGNGAYLVGRMFDKSEIKFLIDAVFSSRSIGQKEALDITNKLQNFLSTYERQNFKYVAKSGEMTRTNYEGVFYNIDLLLEAIENGKKIQFNYNRLYIDKEKNEKKKNRVLVASPYYLVNNQGKYYLVCNNNYFDDISNYRVERMENIDILDEDVKPLKTIKGCANFDITKYANDNIYMFSSETVNAKVKISDEYAVSYVQDWFGNNAKIYQCTDNQIYADIRANEQALIYWCLQYGESIELLQPLDTREKIKNIVGKMGKNYG